MTTSPKILPWLARKSGLSQEKAEAVWSEEFADGSFAARCMKNPDLFYRGILERFRQLAELESGRRASGAPRSVQLQASSALDNGPRGDAIGPGFVLA